MSKLILGIDIQSLSPRDQKRVGHALRRLARSLGVRVETVLQETPSTPSEQARQFAAHNPRNQEVHLHA